MLDRDGRMVAGMVFHNWNPDAETIEVSGAALTPRWATRTVLREMARYAFSFAQMGYARTDPDNAPVLRLLRAAGADVHTIPRMRGRTASEAIVTLTAEAWAQSKLARHNGRP